MGHNETNEKPKQTLQEIAGYLHYAPRRGLQGSKYPVKNGQFN